MIIYSTTDCPRCKALKKALKKLGVAFTEKNLDDTDIMADLVMQNITILSAPALQIGKLVFEYRGDMK